ncbi:ATP-binding cassette domain-containing protein [Pseudonocardia sp. RS11V-5]|uniref:ABC transporter ATP-binding protein n=1 Tax=Pseudonocardia terrae TaxID=2905831 RepID=UPI001E3320EB|nr:ATP-binding cassette domain-containing protein [Pseudonocardia terrae]MCE3551117.1 ATP-binding cassette domain-containing protein [Pseudonocardia terrae]
MSAATETRPGPTEAAAGLRARGVVMRFGGVTALDDVAIELAVGTWTGLIGPNGSGKTTLLNVLSGVYRPQAGSIELDGVDVGGARAGRLARAGIVRTFQHPQLAESLTVWENLLLGVDLRRRRQGRRGAEAPAGPGAEELLEVFGCTRYAGHLPAEAPYGIRKSVELARAVVAEPGVLLLDEPAAGLSKEERSELVGSLRWVRERRPDLAVCLIEHDVRLVAAVCPTIQVLNFGRVLAVGTAAEVLRAPAVQEAYLGRSARHLDRDGGGS